MTIIGDFRIVRIVTQRDVMLLVKFDLPEGNDANDVNIQSRDVR
jgi:hypothetical protein